MKPTQQRIDRIEAGLQRHRERQAGPRLLHLAGEDLAAFCSETGRRFAPNVTEVWIWQTASGPRVVKVLSDGLSYRDLLPKERAA